MTVHDAALIDSRKHQPSRDCASRVQWIEDSEELLGQNRETIATNASIQKLSGESSSPLRPAQKKTNTACLGVVPPMGVLGNLG
jgi:hypothetical protein